MQLSLGDILIFVLGGCTAVGVIGLFLSPFVFHIIDRWRTRAVPVEPGEIAPDPPQQNPLRSKTFFYRKKCKIKPVARFNFTARLLESSRYRMDKWARLSPIDFAIGWGPMSDTAVLDNYITEHRRRWVYFKPRKRRKGWHPNEIAHYIANLHLIPSTSDVMNTLKQARCGELVTISGYLVDVVGPYAESWKTSIERTDLGGEACEIVWVKDATVTRHIGGTTVTDTPAEASDYREPQRRAG